MIGGETYWDGWHEKGCHENLGRMMSDDVVVSIQKMVKVKSVPKKYINKKRWEGAYAPIAAFLAADKNALLRENEDKDKTIQQQHDTIQGYQHDLMFLEETNEIMHGQLITTNIELEEARMKIAQLQQLTRQTIREIKKREQHARMKAKQFNDMRELNPNAWVPRMEPGAPRLIPTSIYEADLQSIMDVTWLATDEVLEQEEV